MQKGCNHQVTKTITHHPAGLRFELHCRCCFIGLLHLWLFLSNNLFLAQSVSLVPEVNHWNHSKHNPDTNCSPPLLSQSLGANYEMKEHLMFLHAPPKKKTNKPQHYAKCKAKQKSSRLPRRANAFFVAGMMVLLCPVTKIIQNGLSNAIPNSRH